MAEILVKLVSEHHHLVLNYLAGKKIINKAKNVFYHIDSDFDKYKDGVHTPKRTIKVYNLSSAGGLSIKEAFEALPGDLSQKWLSQSQVTKVCKHFRAWLKNDNEEPVFFLCKISEDTYFNDEDPWKNLMVVEVEDDYQDDLYVRIVPESVVIAKRFASMHHHLIVPYVPKRKSN